MNHTKRDNKFDNIKGVMIFLVLFCHFFERMYTTWYEDSVTRYLYYFVYLFHMPVFVFISGYFSKKNNSDDYYKKTISTCLVPYLLFDFLYCLIDYKGNFWDSILGFTYPQWTLWFLLSLFLWRILVKPISLFKGIFFFSILLSLYVGFTELGLFLSLARTFGFLPYFLAGYLISEQHVEKIRSLKKAYALLAFTFAVVALLVIQKKGVGINALLMSMPYSGMSRTASIGVRLLILVTGFICIAGFILITSEKHSMLSVIGKNSIVIYLVHSGIILALTKISTFKIDNALVSIAFAAVFSVVVCLLFGNDPVAKVYRHIIGYISNIIIKKNKQEQMNKER